jgi:predicted DNA-binding protein (MmcQ/YjbR family)
MRDSNVLKRLRTRCLELPETSETSAWGHPNFKAGKRTFVAHEVVGGRPSIAFHVPKTDVDRLMKRAQFFATPYGRGQWVSVWADGTLDWVMVDDLVERAYLTVALKRMIAAMRSPATSRSAATTTTSVSGRRARSK